MMFADSRRQCAHPWHSLLHDNLTIKVVLFAVILLSMTSAGWKLWTSCHIRLELLAWPLALAIALATLHRFVNAYGWVLVLRSMRLSVDGPAAIGVWLMAESRRWLPGCVWGYASRATMAGRLGVNSVAATASMMLELILVLFASAIVALAGATVYGRQLNTNVLVLQSENAVRLSPGVLLLFVIACWLFRRGIGAKLRQLWDRCESLRGIRLSVSRLFIAGFFFIAMNLLSGWITVTLMRFVPGGESIPIPAVLAASSAAWCIGFFAFLSPGGLLVREAALAAMLVPWIAYTDAFALAVLTRLAQLIAEAIAICVLALKKPNTIELAREHSHQSETTSDRLLAT